MTSSSCSVSSVTGNAHTHFTAESFHGDLMQVPKVFVCVSLLTGGSTLPARAWSVKRRWRLLLTEASTVRCAGVTAAVATVS